MMIKDQLIENIIKRMNTVKKEDHKPFDMVTLAISAMKLRGEISNNVNIEDYDYDKFSFKSFDNLNLSGIAIKNKNKTNKWIIGVHGYTSRKEDMLQLIFFTYEMGFNLFLLDLRNHGESDNAVISFGINEKEDLKSAINYLKLNYEVDSIGLYGASMGAFTINYFSLVEQEFARENGVKFGIADCPYKSFNNLLQTQSKMLNTLFQRTDLIDKIYEYYDDEFKINLRKADCDIFLGVEMDTFPMIYLHGKNDLITNYMDSIDLFEGRKLNKQADELVIFENAPHVRALNENKEEYIGSVNKFLKKIGII